MITIKKHRNSIEVSGHAGYSSRGYDIVCSAISTLAYTLIWSLKEKTKDKIELEIDVGYVHLGYGNLSESGQLLVDSFFIGAEGIALEYSDYVQILHE